MKIISKIKNTFDHFYSEQFDRIILWIPVIIGLGAYYSVKYYQNIDNYKILFTSFLLVLSCIIYFINRNNIFAILFATFFWFLIAFLISYLNQRIRNNFSAINGKLYVNIEGKIEDINCRENIKTISENCVIIIKNPTIYQIKNNYIVSHDEKKFSPNYIHKNYNNVEGFQDIDRVFLEKINNYQNVDWIDYGGYKIYKNPPHKIRLFIANSIVKISINDFISINAFIDGNSNSKPDFIGDFDFGFDSKSKGINISGFSRDKDILTSQNSLSSLDEIFANLRKVIEKKIFNSISNGEASIAAALLMGNQNLIPKEMMQYVRNSGLAHIISISGLHLSLAAGIFFFFIRYILSINNYITINYNIKKIAAIAAIISSYFYLKISGSPIPAVRSFLGVLFVMLAILFDKKIDPHRSLFAAALIIILINPYSVFSVSFQLSFAAMISLITINEIIKKKLIFENNYDKIFTLKTKKYFLEMIAASSMAQLANSPFLIYHFSDISIVGVLSNFLAIPLTSILIMPFGFASFFLMPFDLEFIALKPMEYGIRLLCIIAEFFANFKYAHFFIYKISKSILALCIFFGLIFAIHRGFLRVISFFLFILFLFIGIFFFQEKPNILIDKDANFFALYDASKGMLFSRKIKNSRKIDRWLFKMNQKEFKTFDDYEDDKLVNKGIDCYDEMCIVDIDKYFFDKANYIKNRKILFLFKRNKVTEICGKDYVMIVNLTKKYSMPKCENDKQMIIIDNIDIFENGATFFIVEENIIRPYKS